MFFIRILLEAATPLTLILFLLIGSLVCVFTNRKRGAVLQLLAALLVLVVTGYGSGVHNRIASQEHRYHTLTADQLPHHQDQPIEYIVVLGSGHSSDERLPPASQLGGASLYRLTEGIRLLGRLPDARLILTGGPGLDTQANATVMFQAARDLGVPPEKMLTEPDPNDTLQEARVVKKHTGTDPFILVTSAFHMSRAITIFQENGMNPIAAPTDFIVKGSGENRHISLFPAPDNMGLWKQVFYEWLGTIWAYFH